MLALYRDWQVYSTHDFINTDLSQDAQNFLEEVRYLLRDTDEKRGWKGALFVNITLLDVEGDPYKIKRLANDNGQPMSIWDTQISLPSDPDFPRRSRWDRGFSLACIVHEETGRKLDSEPSGRHQALLPRVDLSIESTPAGGNWRTTTRRNDLAGRTDDGLLTNETNAYLTRGNSFFFQNHGHASSGWVGFQAELATVPDLIVAHHLAVQDIERYVNYIARLIPQAEPIQAWVSTTFHQVHTPQQLRAWASQFEDQLRIHAKRRVESWRRSEGVGSKEVPTITRVHESPSGIAADSQNPR
jgi:hypothetical protein